MANPSGGDILVGYVEHLGAALRTMADQVNDVEKRQAMFDRRLTECLALVQGMQEEQCWSPVMSQHGAPARRALADDMPTIQAQAHTGGLQPLRGGGSPLDRLNELVVISSRGKAEPGITPSGGKAGVETQPLSPSFTTVKGTTNASSMAVSEVNERLCALERGQKMVAVAVHRALQASIATRQEQKWHQNEEEWHKCLEGVEGTTSELEQQWCTRISEQDKRLDRLIGMVDALADKVVQSPCSSPLAIGAQLYLTDANEPQQESDGLMDLRAQVAEMQQTIHCLARTQQSMTPQSLRSAPAGGLESPQTMAAVKAHLEHKTNELHLRVDAVQEAKDEQRIELEKIKWQQKDTVEKLDMVEEQCQEYFPKIKSFESKLSMFQKRFTSHQQYVLEALGCAGSENGHHDLSHGDLDSSLPEISIHTIVTNP